MYVIRHKDPGVYGHIVLVRILLQPMSVSGEIIVRAKAYLTSVASLAYMLGYTGKADSG